MADRLSFKNIFSLEISFVLIYRVDSDAMPHRAVFQMGFHCLATCLGGNRVYRFLTIIIEHNYVSRHDISNNVACATNKASDQPAHTRSLIRAFAGNLNIL